MVILIELSATSADSALCIFVWPASCTKIRICRSHYSSCMTEAAVKNLIKLIPNIFILLTAAILASACSETLIGTDESQPPGQVFSASSNLDYNPQSSTSKVISATDERPLPAGMVAFDGIVFVASTDLIPDRWKLAGWKIGSQSQATDNDQVPSDCTLYPHLGVEDQWIGSCYGYTFVPEDGASHIAVMHTPPDGTTILVQVAPQPDSEGP
jgi:hypothetical protein